MKNGSYEDTDEMNKCKVEARVEIEKLHKKLGFVVFEVAEEIRLKGKTPIQRRQYYMNKCRGGSSY